MEIKQIQAAFRNILFFTFLGLAFAYISKSHQIVEKKVTNYKKGYSSFEEQSKHHGKFLLCDAPRLHFNLKEQNAKNLFQDAVLGTKLISNFTHFYLPAARYFRIIHLFFLKHQLLLYPFHSLW
ncbi:hypothetical protein [Desertivirga arenae]|uniref:hypothetical protein n=1 Tax=Desertivirga arenae TaxID=2810309 RepID=UPI001A95ACA1|nr:hypothetical protein [Pedobacter sp. SYSU D00823]